MATYKRYDRHGNYRGKTVKDNRPEDPMRGVVVQSWFFFAILVILIFSCRGS
jgi:hypothetical protein